MSTRSVGILVAAGVIVATILTGCGPKDTRATGSGQPTTGAPPAASPTSAAPAAPPVKNITAGNCTLYSKADAVKLIGAVNGTNPDIGIGTDGGTRIDVCSYLDFKSLTELQGITYAVVRYDSAATAFAEAKKVQTQELDAAFQNNWPVQSLTTPVPGAGQLLGGVGTKTDHGITYTLAVVGTNVGPYLVAALGLSSVSPDTAKRFVLTVFQALSVTVS